MIELKILGCYSEFHADILIYRRYTNLVLNLYTNPLRKVY